MLTFGLDNLADLLEVLLAGVKATRPDDGAHLPSCDRLVVLEGEQEHRVVQV